MSTTVVAGLPLAAPRETRIQALLHEASSATAAGRLLDALRCADAARRLVPGDRVVHLLTARLLVGLGRYVDALRLLDGGDLTPAAQALRAEALVHRGQLESAAVACRTLLREHAADAMDGLDRALAALCEADPARYPGWVGVSSALGVIGAAPGAGRFRWKASPDDLHLSIEECSEPLQYPYAAFSGAAPAVAGTYEYRSGGAELLGSPLRWPPEIASMGWVADDAGTVRGEIAVPWLVDGNVNLEIADPSGAVTTHAVPANGPFALPLADRGGPLHAHLVLPDGRRHVLTGSPVVRDTTAARSVTVRPVRPRPQGYDLKPSARRIDVIVPVYADVERTLRCLTSVLATVDPARADIVVVDDATPDAALRDRLSALAAEGAITLLVNPTNLGFPGAANRGMRLHPERDVVLLNADCEVYGDWLGRLSAAAYSAHDIATVTPFGDEASIVTYGAERADFDGRAIDAMARRANAGQRVEIPVGVGFCMYVRRACLDEVGLFDEAAYGRGYGEENDLCLRARQTGWRHVAAADVYVAHSGAHAYGREKPLLTARNRVVLNARFPGYEALVAGHQTADPLRAARRAIDLERLKTSGRSATLLVTLALPGGVRRYVQERAERLRADGLPVLVLKPEGNVAGRVRLLPDRGPFDDLVFDLPGDGELFADTLRGLGLRAVEIHHFLDLPAFALELATQLGVPYRVVLHDHAWICPRLTLLGGDGRYCGEPAVRQCDACVAEHGADLPLGAAPLRERSARLLAGADRVVCASEDTQRRYRRHFPSVAIDVEPWEPPVAVEPAPPEPLRDRVRVAVIGALSAQKGYRVLLECARLAASRDTALEFVLFGYSEDDAALLATGRVFVIGSYEDDEIPSLLERERCHVAFFPSVTPETWCYALTHALRARLPIVAFQLGAIAERLSAVPNAELLPLGSGPEDIEQTLLGAAVRAPRDWARRGTSKINSTSTSNFGVDMNEEHRRPTAPEQEASVQLLSLPPGVYAFSIAEGAEPGEYGGDMKLPALHVGVAPVKPGAQVDFFAGPGTLDRWLAHAGDRVTARIVGEGDAHLLLTSVRRAQDPALSIDVRRVDVAPAAVDGVPGVRIMVHVQLLGDLFLDAAGRGPLVPGLWIEAIVIDAVDASGATLVEYRGVTGDGFETPWLTDSVLCGSRGRGTPLMAFAARPRVAFARAYDCSYVGHFRSGAVVGPIADGTLCRSALDDDPLEGVELRLRPRA